MCRGSETLSNNIRIKVDPEFIPSGDVDTSKDKYLFLYRIDIHNFGEQSAQLISRYWRIINSEGEIEEVRGSGVVGYTPILKAGDSFVYTSYCPLDTPWGTMEGYFSFIRDDGELFDAIIDRFYLIAENEMEG